MLETSLICTDQFWKVLKLVCEKNQFEAHDLANELGLGLEELTNILDTALELGLDYKKTVSGDEVFYQLAEIGESAINSNPFEWVAFQAIFHDQSDQVLKILKLIRPYMKNEMDLSDMCESRGIMSHFSSHDRELLMGALRNKGTIQICVGNEKPTDVYVQSLIYLDGSLSLVYEECASKCLKYASLDTITNIKYSKAKYAPNYSPVEVDDFINAIRAVSENELRLVLKIKGSAEVDLAPLYHFLGSPYVTESADGDMIWAATVEFSDQLFSWLFDIQDAVEIMDPPNVKDEFERYCLARVSEKKLKKAS